MSLKDTITKPKLTHQITLKPDQDSIDNDDQVKEEEEEEEEEEEDEGFEIDYIIRQKFSTELGMWQYLVKWSGYSSEYNTWEPKENIVETKEFDDFIKKKTKLKKQIKKEETQTDESESSSSDLSSIKSESNQEEEEKEKFKEKRKRKEIAKGKRKEKVIVVRSEDSSSSDDEPLDVRNKPIKKVKSNQTNSTSARETRQSTTSQRKRKRKVKPKPTIIPIKDSLESLLQQNSHYESNQDILSNAQTAINCKESESIQFGLNQSSIVIWSSKTNSSKQDFETLSLWYILENQGNKRVKFGELNQNLKNLKNSIPIQSIKSNQVERLFIHRNSLNDFKSSKSLNELVKSPNYIPLFEFGTDPNDVSYKTKIPKIRPIMMMGSILIPSYNCIMNNLTTTTNPFQIFRAIQKENYYSKLFLHPITTKLLCNKYNSIQTEVLEKEAIEELFKDLEIDLIPISKEEKDQKLISNSRFGVLKLEMKDQENFKEIEEFNGIINGLNLIKKVLYRDIRRFIILVDDHSSWLNPIDHEKIDLISSVEVMSISEATERFANCRALL